MSRDGGRSQGGMGIVTCDLSISLDGYSAGPNQTLKQPFGDGVGEGDVLHSWMFDHADDHRDELAGILAAGAFVMGRNMFSPGRGAWDLDWKGWWGQDPPYHAPVFVLTHVERDPVEMEGGTTFHFVTGGPEAALALARDAAGDRNVAVAGGATTVNQFLAAGLIDELRLHVAPRWSTPRTSACSTASEPAPGHRRRAAGRPRSPISSCGADDPASAASGRGRRYDGSSSSTIVSAWRWMIFHSPSSKRNIIVTRRTWWCSSVCPV